MREKFLTYIYPKGVLLVPFGTKQIIHNFTFITHRIESVYCCKVCLQKITTQMTSKHFYCEESLKDQWECFSNAMNCIYRNVIGNLFRLKLPLGTFILFVRVVPSVFQFSFSLFAVDYDRYILLGQLSLVSMPAGTILHSLYEFLIYYILKSVIITTSQTTSSTKQLQYYYPTIQLYIFIVLSINVKEPVSSNLYPTWSIAWSCLSFLYWDWFALWYKILYLT